jgi:hypothetical protein
MSRTAALHFLCGCLSNDRLPGSQDALLRSAQSNSFAWETFVQIASETGVAPAVFHSLQSKNLVSAVPQDVMNFFDGIACLNRQRNGRLLSEATELAAILNQIDVVPVFLKGTAHLLTGLYPDVAERVTSDLDVLVPANRISDCADSLLAQRYDFLCADLDFSGHHHYPPLSRSGSVAVVELHHELFDLRYRHLLPPAAVFSEAVILEYGAAKLAVPSGQGRLIHAVAHAQLADHAYLYGRFPLRELVDFARLHDAFAHDIDWSELARRFAACGAETALAFHLLAAKRLLNVAIHPSVRVSRTAESLYRRALWQVDRPTLSRIVGRLLRPYFLLWRSLSDAVLRRRLFRNLRNREWWRRRWHMLFG